MGAMEAMIHQNEKNNPAPLLEAMIHQNEQTKDAVVQAGEKVAGSVADLKPSLDKSANASEAFLKFLELAKGERGERGEKGEKGDVGEVGPVGPKGEDGVTPVKGVDYFDGENGKDGAPGRDGEDAEVDYEKIISDVLPLIPTPKDGKPGKNGSPDSGEDIVRKLTDLPEKNRLSFDALKDVPNIFRSQLPGSRDYAFTELTDVPKSYVGLAGKFLRVKADESGLEFAAGGGGGDVTNPLADNTFLQFGTTSPISIGSITSTASVQNVITMGSLSNVPILFFTANENKTYDWLGANFAGLITDPAFVFTSASQVKNQFAFFQVRSSTNTFAISASDGDFLNGTPQNASGVSLLFKAGDQGTLGGSPGSVSIEAGNATFGNTNGGDLILRVGIGHGAGSSGFITPGASTVFNFKSSSFTNFFTSDGSGIAVHDATATYRMILHHDGTNGLIDVTTGNVLFNHGIGSSAGSSAAIPVLNPLRINAATNADNWLEMYDGRNAALSTSGAVRQRYNGSSGKWEVSINGAAYVNVLQSTPGGSSGSIQYNNSGLFGGIAMGSANQALAVNGAANGYIFINVISPDGSDAYGTVPYFSAANQIVSASPIYYNGTDKIGFFTTSPGAPLSFNAQTLFKLPNNTSFALNVTDASSHAYFSVTTSTGSENISFGNATTNNTFSFLGSGKVSIGSGVANQIMFFDSSKNIVGDSTLIWEPTGKQLWLGNAPNISANPAGESLFVVAQTTDLSTAPGVFVPFNGITQIISTANTGNLVFPILFATRFFDNQTINYTGLIGGSLLQTQFTPQTGGNITVSDYEGMMSQFTQGGSGGTSTIIKGSNFTSRIFSFAGGSTTTLYGFWARGFMAKTGGSVGTYAGIKIDNETFATTNWGLADDADQNYFAGSTSFGKNTAPSYTVDVAGDIAVTTAGNGFRVKEGSNARMGSATLVGGTVTVNTTAVTANSRIFLTAQNNSGTVAAVSVSGRTAGTSFTITSLNVLDTSTIGWIIVEPA